MSSAPRFPTLTQDGVPTHVLVPIDEFRKHFGDMALSSNHEDETHRLLRELDDRTDPDAVAAREALKSIADPAALWIDAGSVRLRVAGSRIAAIRKARGLSQDALGRMVDLPQSQISRLERDPDRASVATLKRLAEALGVSVNDLV